MRDLVLWPASLRRHDLATQIRAAAAAGFDSLAIAPEIYRRARATGMTPAEMRQRADDAGIALRHLDTLTGWTSIRVPANAPDSLIERFDLSMDESFEIIEALGLQTILAVAGFDAGQVSLGQQIDGFGALCERAAQAGIWVDLEFMPFWGLPDLAAAHAVVAGAGAPNAGIMIDTWHFCKGQPDLALLDKIPGHLLRAMQINDGFSAPVTGSLHRDTVDYRAFPLEGDLDVLAVVRAVVAKGGLERPGVEVFAREADAMEALPAAHRSAASVKHLLDRAGWKG